MVLVTLRDTLIRLYMPALALLFLFFLIFLGNKVKHRVYQVLFIIISLFVCVFFLLFFPLPGSVAMLNLAVAFVMTVTVYIFKFIKLSILDYSVMFACFFSIVRFIGFNPLLFGSPLTVLYFFIAFLSICKLRLKKLNGHLFYIWLVSILTIAEGYLFNLIFFRYVLGLGQPLESNIEKLLVWGIAVLILITLNLAVIYAIKWFFGNKFDEINQMGKAYPKIERFFIYNSIIILLVIALFNFGYQLFVGYNLLFLQISNLFIVFALIIQLSFLIMVFRITWLKDTLKLKTLENQSLAEYSYSLEKNMENIKSIKHDIKNLFLTMGNFVEQSGNTEMQVFYRDKISPFANEEILKSDLYGKLAAINNEQLKAFLFYKISQAIELGIPFDLEISQEISVAPKLEFTDLVRILGILLDNAIEECIELEQRAIQFKISQNKELAAYIIKNTVNSEKKASGIKPNISTKGNGRGNGLMIIKNILNRYNCAALNSYFQEDCFVQNLVVYY